MYIKWGFLQLKRNIRSFSFWCTLVILLLTFYICNYVEREHGRELDIYLCSEDSEMGDRVIDYLMDNADEGYIYHISDDRDDIYKAIIRGETTCGFVFTEEFDDAVREGKGDGEVLLYQAVNTLDGYTLREVVYPAILTCVGPNILADYLDQMDTDEEAKEYVLNKYISLMDAKGLSIYNSQSLSDPDNKADTREGSSLSFGLMLLLIVLATILSAWDNYRNNRHIFLAMKKSRGLALGIETGLINLLSFLLPLGIMKIFLN